MTPDGTCAAFSSANHVACAIYKRDDHGKQRVVVRVYRVAVWKRQQVQSRKGGDAEVFIDALGDLVDQFELGAAPLVDVMCIIKEKLKKIEKGR